MAQLKILSAGAVQPGLVKVIDCFRREIGHETTVSFATAPELQRRLSGGELADVMIAPAHLLDELLRSGNVTGEPVVIGRIGVGVMIRPAAPVPAIATVEELKRSLLSAESIVFNQASTGLYIDSLFSRLGIAADLEARITRCADFAAVRDHIANGHGKEIGFGATTVIIENAAKGIHFVGPLPEAVQNFTTYTAALTANAGDAGHDLLRYLAAPAAKSIFAAAGIQ